MSPAPAAAAESEASDPPLASPALAPHLGNGVMSTHPPEALGWNLQSTGSFSPGPRTQLSASGGLCAHELEGLERTGNLALGLGSRQEMAIFGLVPGH